VKVYLDTNIVVARAVKTHQHHVKAIDLFQQIQSRRWTPVISAHGLSEIFAVLSRTPYQPRISPAAAWQILEENIISSFEIETLTSAEHIRTIKECAAQGWSGGLVYDALHMATARKAGCSRIYTLDVSHFRKLAPDLHDRILAP
jgi:predicted nucleic acid-binding protein